MKQQMMLLGLALSVLFNVFFVAGYLRARKASAGAPADDAVSLVSRELELDPAQSALFAELRDSGREDAEVYEGSITLVRQELVEELGREQRDLDRLTEIVDREADLHRQWRLSEAGRFTGFAEALTPQQRGKLVSRMSRGAMHRHRRQEMLHRFDADGDGALDGAERMAARQFMEARRAEREHRWREHLGGPRNGQRGPRMERHLRAEILNRFDADGNRLLEPQERQALIEWIEGRPERD